MLVPARRGLVHLALVCSGRFESIRRRSATKAGWASFTITAELIGFAYAKQPLLTLVALLYGLQEAGDAMSDELWEFVSCSSAWPVANALVGLGTEVLIVCQIFGAVIEESREGIPSRQLDSCSSKPAPAGPAARVCTNRDAQDFRIPTTSEGIPIAIRAAATACDEPPKKCTPVTRPAHGGLSLQSRVHRVAKPS